MNNILSTAQKLSLNLQKQNINQQLEFINTLDLDALHSQYGVLEYLSSRTKQLPQHSLNLVDIYLYKRLRLSKHPDIVDNLCSQFPKGLIKTESSSGFDYNDLQELLIYENFQEADKLTSKKMYSLIPNSERGWLYFCDIKQLPSEDLLIINNLWSLYSCNKFGFARQRKIWLDLNKDWNKLWTKIGWQKQYTLCRYPNEFIWTLDAPPGHLPLSNQLRGNTVLKSIFDLTIWD